LQSLKKQALRGASVFLFGANRVEILISDAADISAVSEISIPQMARYRFKNKIEF